jgi:DNA-binding response OmpR family regulator
MILVVDDDLDLVDVVRTALEREGFAVDDAGDGATALDKIADDSPELVVLDLGLPKVRGLDVLRQVRADNAVPVIVLSGQSDEADRIIGLELGADDYVVKPFAVNEVVARIRAVLRRGRAPEDERELLVRDLRIDIGSRQVWLAEREIELSRKEFELLLRLARDAGRVVSRESLMSDVWDVNWFGSTKTLDVHVAWLRRKLGDDPASPMYIHTVRGVGFRLGDRKEQGP